MSEIDRIAVTWLTICWPVTAIRSISDILQEDDDLNPTERGGFQLRLSDTARELGDSTKSFLDQIFKSRTQDWHNLTPEEQVDDFLIDHKNHFPTLEAAATRIRASLLSRHPHLQTALALELDAKHGIKLDVQHGASKDAKLLKSGYVYNPHAKSLLVRDLVPEPTIRFQMARVLAMKEADAEIQAIISGTGSQFGSEGTSRAYQALSAYTASALLFPYEEFLETARSERYDLDVLVQRFSGSFEQICHRLTTLRRPRAEGIPFSFLRSDMAGNSSKRFSVQGLRMPRQGSACPLWALYQAFRTPGGLSVQLAKFPNNTRFLFIARTITKQASAYRAPQQSYAIMIGCDVVYADQTVYGDGLNLSGPAAATPVGTTCRLCPREGCPQRAHQSLL